MKLVLLAATAVTGLFVQPSETDAHVVKAEHQWEGPLSTLLADSWKIHTSVKDKDGKTWLVMNRKPYPDCTFGEVAYCDTVKRNVAPPEADMIQCFIPVQFDICGQGLRTNF
jgi:hypothetical protein